VETVGPYVCLCVDTVELGSTDDSGWSAWDYARVRQLHYCMLIIASYLRQRAHSSAAGSLSQPVYRHDDDFDQPALGDSQTLQVAAACLSTGNESVPKHMRTHPFNGPLSGTTWVSWYQKGKNQSGFY